MPTSPPSRAAAKFTEQEPGEIEIAAATVLETSMLVASARLDESVDPGEFAEMLTALIEAVRHDEQQRAKALVVLKPPTKRIIKFMSEADARTIRARAEEAKRGRAKLPQGFADNIAVELGYTKSQVQGAIYAQGI